MTTPPTGGSTWQPPRADWRPRLVALDIDGTLLRWVEGLGMSREEVTPAVHDAIQRVLDAGCHVVLSSGRALHNMTSVADMLDLVAVLRPSS